MLKHFALFFVIGFFFSWLVSRQGEWLALTHGSCDYNTIFLRVSDCHALTLPVRDSAGSHFSCPQVYL